MIIGAIVVLILTVLDQYSKYLVDSRMQMGDTIPIIKDFFHLTYVQNKGIAFGLFFDRIPVLVLVNLLAIVGIILFLYKKNEEHSLLAKIGFLFILGGAIGNLYDRIFRGFVVDFMDFRGIWQYIFNVADVYINIGAFLILLEYFIFKENYGKAVEEEPKKEE